MKKPKNKKQIILVATVASLMLLSFLSGILASKLLVKTDNNSIPTSAIEIDTNNNNISNNSSKTESQPTAGLIIEDKNGKWKKNTVIDIFKAEYSENGKITVKSAYGDKVIAPGTSNSYYFDIKNIGEVPVYYTLTAEAELSFKVNGKKIKVPLEARFCDHYGAYLLGSENRFEDMNSLDGLKDSGGISEGNYVRYTLDWQWPFENNDELDTLLGTMVNNGDELSVSVRFNITANEDKNASGGSPQTGDNSNIGLWTALLLGSLFAIVLLLFYRKKEREDKE